MYPIPSMGRLYIYHVHGPPKTERMSPKNQKKFSREYIDSNSRFSGDIRQFSGEYTIGTSGAPVSTFTCCGNPPGKKLRGDGTGTRNHKNLGICKAGDKPRDLLQNGILLKLRFWKFLKLKFPQFLQVTFFLSFLNKRVQWIS